MRSTKHNGASTDDLASHSPVLFIVDADREARIASESALIRRFAPDYRVLTADTPEAGLEGLRRLAQRGEEVALVAADLRLPDMDGIAFLELARALHRRAVRALLVAMDRCGPRIPFGELQSLQRATALGPIDFWAVKGWAAPEELLYSQMQEALSGWPRAAGRSAWRRWPWKTRGRASARRSRRRRS